MKKNYLLSVLSIFILLPFFSFSAKGQQSSKTNKSHLSIGTDLVSRYIWRGSQFGGNVPNIQPSITYDYGGFEAGVWGSFSLSGANTSQEVDLFVSHSFVNNLFTVTLTDYFFPVEFGNYNYFNYGKNETGHIFEGSVMYNGTENFPLTAMIATNFFGADAAKIEANPHSPEFNQKTGIQYSTYLELGYPFQINNIDISTFIGLNATTPKKEDTTTGYLGETGFYGDKIGVINLGFTASKSIQITKKFALPLSVSFITNPQSKKIYFVFGISF